MTESSGACDARRNGVAHRVLPILSLVVLSRVARVYWRASRLLSDGGETRDMINENSSFGVFIAGCPTGRPGRFRATYPAPVLRRLRYQWPRVSGEASETPPSPSCAAPGGSFPHVS